MDVSKISLDERQKKTIARLAQQAGMAWHQYVDFLLGAKGASKDSSQSLSKRQYDARNRLFQQLDQLPGRTPQDGLSNRDHDDILYGDK